MFGRKRATIDGKSLENLFEALSKANSKSFKRD
jgi:hypothetical protein